MTLLAASTFVWIFILLPLLIVWAIGLVDIVRRPLSGVATAAWILVVVVFPFAGTLVYFLLRKPTPEEIRLKRAATDPGRADRRTDVGPRPPVD